MTKDATASFGWWILGFLLFVLAFFLGSWQGFSYARHRAVDAGVGEFFVDSHGSTEFRWITQEPTQ